MSVANCSSLVCILVRFAQHHYSDAQVWKSLTNIRCSIKSLAQSTHTNVIMLSFLLSSSITKHFSKPYCSVSVDPTASLTLHFLRQSCGLSQEPALAISKKFHLKRTAKPHSVLSLFKSYNFSKSDIKRVVTRVPELLLYNPEQNLKPKLAFFEKIGFSGNALTFLITCVPSLLQFSLENMLLPNYKILKSILHTDENVMSAIKSSSALLVSDLDKTFVPNVKILEQNGVSDGIILKLLTNYDKQLIVRPNRVNEIIEFVRMIGIGPENPTYVHAFRVLGRMRANEWEMKVENFKKLGWTEEEILFTFTKHPYCMSASVDKIAKSIRFFKEKFGWDSSYVSRNPRVLSFSLEKRVMPRYRILSMLKSKGLHGGKVGSYYLNISEKDFLVKFVIKYYEEVRDVIDDDVRCRLQELGLLAEIN